jgi:acetyltransferase-like isoleucine patch superfamily enzyme
MSHLFRTIIARARHAVRSRQLGALGEHSSIDGPALINGAKGIFLDRAVRIWPCSRIECIRWSSYSGTIRIGDGTKIQMYFHCAAAGSVTIGRSVLIAGRVFISDHDHEWPGSASQLIVSPVVIGDNCWLGEGSAVLKGVTLGDNCIVGTNAVVTRSAPAGSMLVGVPARIIRTYDVATGRWNSVGRTCSRR